eukprot:TRINITY_DN51629_c0_g1_i1.p1 TRINITY_DN51629_c0_g1~~TRINITY_DN51629_c0_g1_i1.p1  ORF type:complete len:250 (+),score=130.84 TRINITY_DN51629_c0_g1_i1:25-750(+)
MSSDSAERKMVDNSEQEHVAALLREFKGRLFLQRQSAYVRFLHTKIRDAKTTRKDFVFYSNQLTRMLVEESLSLLPVSQETVVTPTNKQFAGAKFDQPICGVSILRAGESMEIALRLVVRDAKIGKILIQRDETKPDKPATLFYAKVPEGIKDHKVLLLDPMLATGGSARCAIDVLLKSGVREEDIVFVNMVGCPEGVRALFGAYGKITILCSMIDDGLNDDKYILPGLGDFGDRYFGTVE